MLQSARIRIIDLPLSQLQACMAEMIMPPARCRDVELLEGQIQLRLRALRDMAVIRSRLRPCRGRPPQKATRPMARRRSRVHRTPSLQLAGPRI